MTLRPELVEAWDSAAEKLGRIPLVAERVRYAVALKPVLDLPRTARILEAGCGAGRTLRALSALGYDRTVGLEISPARLEHVRRVGPESAALVCSDGVPFAVGSFDAVVSAGVIEHVVQPREWLGQLASVTRRGGIVSITSDAFMWRWLKKLGLYRTVQPLDDAIWPLELIRWGESAGLKLIACGGFVNTADQRWYFVKQLLTLTPAFGPIWRSWLHPDYPPVSADESQAIVEAIDLAPGQSRRDLWGAIWSYESYFWFRKR